MIGLIVDHWDQWTAVVACMTLLFCFSWVRPRFGLSASLLFAAVSYSAIYTWVFVPNRYVMVEPYNQMALRYFACDSLCKMMLVLVPIMVLSKNRMTMLLFGEMAASLFVLSSSILALWEARLGCNGLNCGGLIGNASISMGFMACLLPIFIRSWRAQWPILLLAACAILLSKSSIAVGLLAAYGALWLTPWKAVKELGWKALLPPAIAAGGVMTIARFALGKELLNDSDRFMIWRFMFDRWRAPWNIFQGTGFGTYHVISINLQNRPNMPAISGGYWWETMHNDPLQMLFECGVVGCLLLFSTYLSALLKLLKERDWQIALSVVLYGLYMCLDPALHNPLPVLFGAWLFVYALRKPKEYL